MPIRHGRPADVPTLVRFNLALAQETEARELDAHLVTAGVEAVVNDRRRGFYLVAEQAGQVVGSLLVTTEWSDWRNGWFWWVQSVYVEPAHRRRGVFRALYEAVCDNATAAEDVCGVRLYVEHTNANAQAVYTRLGMTRTSYGLFEHVFTPGTAKAWG